MQHGYTYNPPTLGGHTRTAYKRLNSVLRGRTKREQNYHKILDENHSQPSSATFLQLCG